MSDLMRSRIGRRTFLKATGGAAALAGIGGASGARAARQDAATTLTFAWSTDVDLLDPRQTNTQEGYIACANVYDCLVLYDFGATTIRPGLAESWEISADGKEYTFHLRQGVSFHDGAPLNADAVLTWFNSIKEGATGSQYDVTKMPQMAAFITGWIDRFDKIDDYTVKAVLPNPYSPLLANLAIPIAGVVSPTLVELGVDEAGVSPSGTGAFMLANKDDWTRDSQMVLTPNPNYWGGAPKVQRLVFKVTPEASTRLEQVEAGEIDIAYGLPPDDVNRARENPDVQVVEQAGLNTNCIELNVSKDPFTSKEVRQALNYAVNKEELSQGLYGGDMVPAGGVLPPVDWAANPDLKGYPYDPDKARELLATAGYDENNKLTFTLMAYTISRGYNPVGDRLATAVQEYWKEVNVEVEIQTEEWTQYRNDRRANQFVASQAGWMGDNGDPDNFLDALLSTHNIGSTNTAWYSNPEVDQLLQQAQQEVDQEARKALYQQAEQLIVEDAPWVFLGYQKHQVVVRNNVVDFQLQPSYIYYLGGVSKS